LIWQAMSAIRPRLSRVHIPSLNHPEPSRHNHSQTVSQSLNQGMGRAVRKANCIATARMAGPVASPKNVTEDRAVVARDRSGPIYCVSIAGSSPSASSANDLPNTIRCAISRRHSFRGHSVGCHLNNAKGELSANIGLVLTPPAYLG
jgi:hypothetical protein